MTALYIIIGILIAVSIAYLFAIMPSMRRHPTVDRCMDRPYAHRGLHDSEAGIPENSLAAFGRAADMGFGIELDVHLTADGQLMIMHDNSIKRMTGEDLCMTEQCSDILAQMPLDGTEQRIPFLSQVLELVDGRVPLLVELKVVGTNYAELCRKVCELLDGYDGDFLLESFDPRAIMWLRRNRPELPRGQLSFFYNRHGDRVPFFFDFAMHNFLTNLVTRPHFIAMYHNDKNAFTVSLCRLLFRVPEFSWTVRSPEKQRECEKLGSVVVFENYIPDLFDRKSEQ